MGRKGIKRGDMANSIQILTLSAIGCFVGVVTGNYAWDLIKRRRLARQYKKEQVARVAIWEDMAIRDRAQATVSHEGQGELAKKVRKP